MGRILVVAAHPDDEVLGMGGSIAKHVQAGEDVHVMFLADGVSSRAGSSLSELKKRRCDEWSARIVGCRTG